jgi:methyl-accepting chemotaxis protein
MGQASNRVSELGGDIHRLAETYSGDVGAAGTALVGLGDLVQRTAEQVEQLDRLSQAIYDFIDLTKQISSQTNLLALNAAIEAARGRRARSGILGGRRRSASAGGLEHASC